ncbi:hypothetical protein [Microbacterium sp. PM5]|uniref:hypothetical protein n=1 Tax=Microbacterium sp. PM5 TaxID=2014534 RepID=UPI000DD14C90|nr:hypothetical protein [Microbacterium sp. PM5]AXA96853.1 hypothetical protein CEP17_10800 [Microbacterium sp. PM5]
MTTFTSTIPFSTTYECHPDTDVVIPITKSDHKLADDLKQNAPSARFDRQSAVVTVPLSMAGWAVAYMQHSYGPGVPELVGDVTTSSPALTALYAAARVLADASAPSGLATQAVRFQGAAKVTLDLNTDDSFARVIWTGSLHVTWEDVAATA